MRASPAKCNLAIPADAMQSANWRSHLCRVQLGVPGNSAIWSTWLFADADALEEGAGGLGEGWEVVAAFEDGD